MHDIGMGLLPESIVSNQGKLNDYEFKELHVHPVAGGEILTRMSGWGGAAEMVLQHHEKPNGTGYPNQLSDRNTCSGAKLIATLDAFEAMTHERVNRAHKKSIMRAMVELNACEDQFSRLWIPTFNQVVREMLEANE